MEEPPEMVAPNSTSNSPSESNMIIYTNSQLLEQKWLAKYKYEILSMHTHISCAPLLILTSNLPFIFNTIMNLIINNIKQHNI